MWYKRKLMWLPVILLCCGCYSDDVGLPVSDSDGPADVEESTNSQTSEVKNDARPEITSPAEFKNALLKAALRGLNYESGLVEIDKQVQREVQRAGEGSAAELYAAAQSYYEQNLRIEAIENFTKAILSEPSNADYYHGLGQALVAKGLVDEAEAAFRSALERAPDFLEARFQLAMTKQMQGDQQQANEAWRDVLTVDVDNAQAHSRLAVGLYYTGAYQESWKHVHVAEGLGHNVPPQFRLLLAEKMAEPRN